MKKTLLVILLGLFLSSCITTLESKKETPSGDIYNVSATIIGMQATTLSIDPEGNLLLLITEDKVISEMLKAYTRGGL